MTESSSVIENGLNQFLKNFWRFLERGGAGVSACRKQNIPVVISKFVILAGQRVSCSGKVILRLFKDIHKSISWSSKKRQLTGNIMMVRFSLSPKITYT